MASDLNEAQLLMTAVAALGIGKHDPQNPDIKGAQGVIDNSNCFGSALSSVQEHTAGIGAIDACYVAETEASIILAFRGTLGWGTNVLQNLTTFLDWLNDFNAEPRTASDIPLGKVHSGFYQSVSNLAPFFIPDILNRWLKSNKKKKVVITGYSKGAGMAPLAAVLLRNKNIPVDEVHLYEPPRCGDFNFMLAYNVAFPKTTRYEYQDDLVPHTPPTAIEMALLDSSSAIAGILHLLYPDHDSWNYAPVGKLQFVDWTTPKPQIVSDSDDLEKQRMLHLTDDFAQSSMAPIQDHGLNGHLFDALMQAFSCGCTYPTWVDDPTSYDRLAAQGQQRSR